MNTLSKIFVFTLFLASSNFSLAHAQTAQQNRPFVSSKGDQECCGKTGKTIYNRKENQSAPAPVNIKGILEGGTRNSGMEYRSVKRREKPSTFDFSQETGKEDKAVRLQELSRKTQELEYENAIKRSEARQAALRVKREQMEAQLAMYEEKAKKYEEAAGLEQGKNGASNGEDEDKNKRPVQYIKKKVSSKNDAPKRLFLSDR